MKKLLPIFCIVFLCFACTTTRYSFHNEIYTKIDTLKVSEAINFENELFSIDNTPNHRIQIGEGIYPNEQNFDLATPKTFNRVQKPHFELEVDYFYSNTDSSVKVILYQWDYIKDDEIRNLTREYSDKERIEKIQAFENQFSYLLNFLTDKLGAPNFIEINSTSAASSFRDGYKWLDSQEINAYLFMLGNNQPLL